MSKPLDRYALLLRIQEAAGLSTAQLARVMQIRKRDLEAMLRLARGRTVETDMDLMWANLEAYVNERIGSFLAIREEIARKRTADIKARIERLTRMRQR